MIKFKLPLFFAGILIASFSSLSSAELREGAITHRTCVYYYAGSVFQVINDDTFRECPIPTEEIRPNETVESLDYLYSEGDRDYFRGYTDKNQLCEVNVRTILYAD